MLDLVDTTGLTGIPGDPWAVPAQAARMRAASRDAERALAQIDEGRDTALADWRGSAADAFHAHVGRLRPTGARLIDLDERAAPILEGYADILQAGQAAYARADADSRAAARQAGQAEDGSAEQYQARKAAWDAQRSMQAAQVGVWEANYRAAQLVAALTGRDTPPMTNPYADEPTPPPADPGQHYSLAEELTGVADAKRFLQGDWRAGIWLVAGVTPVSKAAKAAKLAKGA